MDYGILKPENFNFAALFIVYHCNNHDPLPLWPAAVWGYL